MKTYNHLLLIVAISLMATSCGKDDEPDVKIEPPVYNLNKPAAVETVDLGLSVLWSNCNLGASSTTDYGGHFAWGDPTGALWSAQGISYDEQGYNWNTNNYGGNNPPADISGTELDVVAVHWGDGWRMPTYAEMRELRTKCQWTMMEQGGVRWYEVTGPNGNSINLPIAGLYYDPTGSPGARFLGGPAHVNKGAFYFYPKLFVHRGREEGAVLRVVDLYDLLRLENTAKNAPGGVYAHARQIRLSGACYAVESSVVLAFEPYQADPGTDGFCQNVQAVGERTLHLLLILQRFGYVPNRLHVSRIQLSAHIFPLPILSLEIICGRSIPASFLASSRRELTPIKNCRIMATSR